MKCKKIVIAKFALVLAVPIVLWAYSTGPDAHKTGVPGTGETTCVECHLGTLNPAGGSVKLTASGGTTYVPGQKQTLTIAITDGSARVYGFQMTARLAGDRNSQAGTFTPGARQFVLCSSTNGQDAGQERAGAACASNKPIEFVEHLSPFTTNTITVDWTPPPSASGAVEIYVSANAANNDRGDTGDHIYNTSLTLQPASVGAPKPATSQAGVINANQFGAQPGVAPGTWIEIYGTNLSNTTREWAGGDFNGANAPTSLDGVSVTIAGKPAYVSFIKDNQVNVQVPDDIGTGPVALVVKRGEVAGDPVTVTATSTLPGLLAPFTVGGKRYAAAFVGRTIVGSPGFAAVKPGEIITFYGIGFGPVTPATPSGRLVGAGNTITTALSMRIGQAAVDFNAPNSYRGLSPGLVGVYQLNITVPDLPDGDHAITLDLGGRGTGQDIYLSVKR